LGNAPLVKKQTERPLGFFTFEETPQQYWPLNFGLWPGKVLDHPLQNIKLVVTPFLFSINHHSE